MSLANTPGGATLSKVFRTVLYASPRAVGGWLTNATWIRTVAGLETSWPSWVRYAKLSVPTKPEFGVYWKEPFGSNVSVPYCVPLTRDAVSTSPSASVSLANTPGIATVNGVSSSAS